MAGNLAAIVAVELLAAAQGIDLRQPLVTSRRLRDAHAQIRAVAAHWDRDRVFAPDLQALRAQVERGAFVATHGPLRRLKPVRQYATIDSWGGRIPSPPIQEASCAATIQNSLLRPSGRAVPSARSGRRAAPSARRNRGRPRRRCGC
jgi:hypothetical protein